MLKWLWWLGFGAPVVDAFCLYMGAIKVNNYDHMLLSTLAEHFNPTTIETNVMKFIGRVLLNSSVRLGFPVWRGPIQWPSPSTEIVYSILQLSFHDYHLYIGSTESVLYGCLNAADSINSVTIEQVDNLTSNANKFWTFRAIYLLVDDGNSLAGSTRVRGPASGDSFSLLCLIYWKYSFITTLYNLI